MCTFVLLGPSDCPQTFWKEETAEVGRVLTGAEVSQLCLTLTLVWLCVLGGILPGLPLRLLAAKGVPVLMTSPVLSTNLISSQLRVSDPRLGARVGQGPGHLRWPGVALPSRGLS